MNGILNNVYRGAVYEKTGRVMRFHLQDSQSLDMLFSMLGRFPLLKSLYKKSRGGLPQFSMNDTVFRPSYRFCRKYLPILRFIVFPTGLFNENK